jgi:cytochrome b
VNAVPHRIRVWDLPTRMFHWALTFLVVFSFATGKIGGGWMEWHVKSGYTILVLLFFRIAWGLAGGRTSRFASFVRAPAVLVEYARGLATKRPAVVIGHNPIGGWMVVFLLAILLAQAASGLFADDEIATQGPLAAKVYNAVVATMSSFHYYNGWTIAAAVAVHVIAIAAYWTVLRENLVRPMWTGWRDAPVGAAEPARRATWFAAILLALSAGAVYWLVVVYPKA